MLKKFLMIVLFISLIHSSMVNADEVDAVINVPQPRIHSFEYSDIEDIFLFRVKKWTTGQPIKVFVLPRDNARTRDFTTKFMNMTPSRYYDIIESKESSGKVSLVQVVDSEYVMIRKISLTPGSVGYISDSLVGNFDNSIVIVK